MKQTEFSDPPRGEKSALYFTIQKTNLGGRGNISASSSPHFSFLHHALTLPSPSPSYFDFFFCLQVFFNHISNFNISTMYPFIYFRTVLFISFLATAAVCWLYFFWIRVFFSLDLLLWAIYGMQISQMWWVISHGLDSFRVKGYQSHDRFK
jgi:hypothetical protein